MTLQTYAPPPAAGSRQEVEQLIGFVREGHRQLDRIEALRQERIAKITQEAQDSADAEAQPIKTAITEAQVKVQAWCRSNPHAASAVAARSEVGFDPFEAQRVAALQAAYRPMTERQRGILEKMQAGWVLRREGKLRAFYLYEPGRRIARTHLSTNHVFDLQGRFLDAHDLATGELLLGASAFDKRALEFRIKPDVVLP